MTRISSIRSIDLRLVDDLVDFVRGRGFVLDFSDSSFSEFFATELKVNIDDPKICRARRIEEQAAAVLPAEMRRPDGYPHAQFPLGTPLRTPCPHRPE
jgi:hypothetical protein